jgi:hypothetical protein
MVPTLLQSNGLDRLAMVSKVLLDTRFLEMKRENESLKVSLFWVDHSVNKLKVCMGRANKHAKGPRCRCESCVDCQRYESTILDGYDDEIEDGPCKFKSWFEQVLLRHGLSFQKFCYSPQTHEQSEEWEASYDREMHMEYHDNVHFHVYSSDRAWDSWVYGKKLWDARSILHPELLRLRTLFDEFYEYWSDDEIWFREIHEHD